MADVSKILKPRRGLASTMATAAKSGIVLAKGELFVEAPSTGMGTGASKVKIGDGTTAYSALPYALGDTSNDKINFSSNTSTTVAAALNSVASGNSLKTLIAGLKQAISLCNTSITQLNDDIDEAGGIGMTTEQANQLQEIYNRLYFGINNIVFDSDKQINHVATTTYTTKSNNTLLICHHGGTNGARCDYVITADNEFSSKELYKLSNYLYTNGSNNNCLGSKIYIITAPIGTTLTIKGTLQYVAYNYIFFNLE